MCLEPTGRETAAELAPRGRERGLRPLNSCVELEGWTSGGREVGRILEGPRVADLVLSLQGEGGAERELVARVTPILLANDFCLSCRKCHSSLQLSIYLSIIVSFAHLVMEGVYNELSYLGHFGAWI